LPGLAQALVFERKAILDGQLWRFLSCHLVHFSDIHLFYNLIALGIVGWIFEYRSYPYFISLCACMALSIGLSVLILKPEVSYYGGLSGLVCGCIIYVVLFGLRESHPWRLIYLLVLFVLAGKLLLECYKGDSILPYMAGANFVLLPLSHFVGSLVALIVYLGLQFIPNHYANITSDSNTHFD